jgi:polyisoprenyl-phosphate glycosyltransferase
MAHPEDRVDYSIVIPVYKNEESLPEVVAAVSALGSRLPGTLEAVFVVDGSPDRSARVLRALLARSPLPAQLVLHSRNFGSFAAIRTGMSAARGQYLAVMAADLQEPIELVEKFFHELQSGGADIVVGVRTKRDDPAFSRAASTLYWRLYRRLVQPEMPPGGVDVFGCTRAVSDQLVAMPEANSSLVGLLFWLGYDRREIPYERLERRHGSSAWSFRKKFSYLLDSVFSFTALPISAILVLGIFGTVSSLLAAVIVAVAWIAGAIEVPGYTAEMLVMLFTTGSILFALGIVGTYVWRAFENSKSRPQSVVMAREAFPSVRD